MQPKQHNFLVVVLSLVVLTGVTACASPTNSAATGQGGIEPHMYTASYDRVFAAAKDAFTRWPRGREILDSDSQTGRIHGYSETSFFKFKDDIYVTVTREGSERTRVGVQSKGRQGEYDFGGNARNISEYFTVLDRLLQ
ncbi:DUF1499 domain-containing protein [Anthocerotibacter panamensis]|uniref:DUF1499 domain-containing protein n=1 Tax=Anthocerotibacter panamensis TaxID=2857077 RepID=UPI001C405CA7|nr:DUF1499 domain-containing protein [Anthocerotibacter panamensis]